MRLTLFLAGLMLILCFSGVGAARADETPAPATENWAWVWWGHPDWTAGEIGGCGGADWLCAARKVGGQWLDAPFGWHADGVATSAD